MKNSIKIIAFALSGLSIVACNDNKEKDKSYVLAVNKSQSKQYIFIGAYSNTTYEFWYMDANKIDDEEKIIVETAKSGGVEE